MIVTTAPEASVSPEISTSQRTRTVPLTPKSKVPWSRTLRLVLTADWTAGTSTAGSSAPNNTAGCAVPQDSGGPNAVVAPAAGIDVTARNVTDANAAWNILALFIAQGSAVAGRRTSVTGTDFGTELCEN